MLDSEAIFSADDEGDRYLKKLRDRKLID